MNIGVSFATASKLGLVNFKFKKPKLLKTSIILILTVKKLLLMVKLLKILDHILLRLCFTRKLRQKLN